MKNYKASLFLTLTVTLILFIGNSCKEEEKDKIPLIETSFVRNVATTSILCGGYVYSDGGASIVSRGICWSTNKDPKVSDSKTSDGIGLGEYTSLLEGLLPSRTYYLRAYATNRIGTAYGNEVSVKTISDTIIIVNTTAVSATTLTTITTGGTILSDGGMPISARGICYSISKNPLISSSHTDEGTGVGSFVSILSGLEQHTKYFLRAYATNSRGTMYGNEISVSTSFTVDDGISDADGNGYHAITIGSQTWMQENLRTTKYSDGSLILNVADGLEWNNQSEGAYCWYNNDIGYKNTFGALYNWYAVVDSRFLCPSGWHMPSDEDWSELENYLGGSDIAGGKLKQVYMWESPNTSADNSSGFSALPGGYIMGGVFFGDYRYGGWWTNTEIDVPDQSEWVRTLSYNNAKVNRIGVHVSPGFSVRCIKD